MHNIVNVVDYLGVVVDQTKVGDVIVVFIIKLKKKKGVNKIAQQEVILALEKCNDWMTTKQIAIKLKLSNGSVFSNLQRLYKEGLLTKKLINNRYIIWKVKSYSDKGFSK